MATTKKNSNPTRRKSMKMESDELMEKIKSCVKEALEEQTYYVVVRHKEIESLGAIHIRGIVI